MDHMFALQEAFMRHVGEKYSDFPREWPIDMTTKAAQRLCRDTVWKAQHELAEAVIELKNAKEHRVDNAATLDRSHFIEELVDAWKYMQEVMIFMGVSVQEFYDAYLEKDAVIHRRLDEE